MVQFVILIKHSLWREVLCHGRPAAQIANNHGRHNALFLQNPFDTKGASKIASKWPKWGSNWQICFHLRFFCLFFCSCFNFSFCKLSLVGTLKATPRSWWKAIQNAHFLPASGLWSKRRENKRAVEMEEYEGSKERTKKLPLDTTCISSTWLGSQQTCKWEWHIWHWCKEAQLQIKYIMGNFIQSSRSRPPFGFLLQNHHSQSVGMKKCLQDLEFVGLLLLDTSVFCLAWLDVEVTHERYRSTLGKFGQPAETKNVARRTSGKSKAPCQQQAAMNIDCSNFLCSSLAPK